MQGLTPRQSGNRLFFGVDEDGQAEPIQATIIQLGGTVHGAKGRGYLNYLPLGGGTPGQALNLGRIQERPGVPVWVGFFQNRPVITSLDFSRMEPNGFQGYRSPLFAQHAPDHRWSSGDPVYVDSRQIDDLMVRPAGLLKVKVNPGWYDNGLTYAYYAGQASYDLASYQPAAGTKRGVGLYLDSAGALQAVAGAIVARTAVLPEPNWPAGVFRLAMVIVFGDKNFVDFEYIKQRKAMWSNPARKVSSLVAADGDPDPAWSVDNDGNLSNPGGGNLDLNGIADALVLDADGDTTISSPTDDQIDFEAGGADIARITAAGLELPQIGDDVFIAGDEAGIKQRLIDLNHAGITDHFLTFSGWTWAAYAGYGTPATIDTSAIADHARIFHNTNVKGFAYQAFTFSTVTSVFGRLLPGEQGYYGLRLDDGSDSNYCQVVAQFVSGKIIIYRESAIAGAVTGPTSIVADLPHSYLHLQIRRTATAALWFYTTDGYTPQFLATVAMSWTPTRWGLYIQNSSATPNSGHSLTIDWITRE